MYAQKKLTPFEQALVDSVLMEYQNIPAEAELLDCYSDGFRHWAEKLKNKTHRSSWYYINTAAKKVILVAILFGLLTMTAFAVPAIRQAVIDFFQDGGRYGISFDPTEVATAPGYLEVQFIPSFVPEGFQLNDHSVTQADNIMKWCNDAGERIVFDQQIILNTPSDNWIGIDADDTSMVEKTIGELKVTIVTHQEGRILFWTNNGYFFSLELPENISDDTMEQMFLSIRSVNE